MSASAATAAASAPSYAERIAERVQATVDEQLARAEANALFKAGDLRGAAAAYEVALDSTKLPENRLALLSNLGLCWLKLGDAAAAARWLGPTQMQALGKACYENPGLAVKACARRLQACKIMGNEVDERSAAADAAFYLRLARAKGAKFESIDLPPADSSKAVETLLMAIGAVEDADGLPEVESLIGGAFPLAKAESCCDDDGINGLALAINIEAMRPTLNGGLLHVILRSGVPPDCRHEAGRTALMLAANTGRVDLCTRLLNAGASAACTDGEGRTALHAACVDLALADEREEAGMASDPPGVVSLLLARGRRSRRAIGAALALAAPLRGDHRAAEEVCRLLEAASAEREATAAACASAPVSISED